VGKGPAIVGVAGAMASLGWDGAAHLLGSSSGSSEISSWPRSPVPREQGPG